MKTFEDLGYEVVRNAISTDLAKFISTEFEMVKETAYLLNNVSKDNANAFCDNQIPESFTWYAPFCFETLSLHIQPIVERVTGTKLYPTYSYGRIYNNGAELVKHKDREGSEFAVTICLQNDDEPWDIFFTDKTGDDVGLTMNPGDICVYRGSELVHWREQYQGSKQIQAFCFYVSVDGQFSWMKYDTRPALGMPNGTKQVWGKKVE